MKSHFNLGFLVGLKTGDVIILVFINQHAGGGVDHPYIHLASSPGTRANNTSWVVIAVGWLQSFKISHMIHQGNGGNELFFVRETSTTWNFDE